MGAVTARAGRPWPLLWLWLLAGAALAGFAALLLFNAHRFDWALAVRQMPAMELGLGMAAAGLVYLAVLPLIRATIAHGAGFRRRIFWLMLAVGLVPRLILFVSAPAMEDDYNRYLWEGALVANGFSPYAVSALDGRRAKSDTALGRLAGEAGPVVERVNHPGMTTTYPPVAQAAFALSHLLAPWNLLVWRAISLACDIGIVTMLIILLGQAGRPELWSALYWWNPLVIKELVNSGHMEGFLMALVLGAMLLAAQGRHLRGLFVLGLAIGAKLWPVLLAPLLLRPLWPRTPALAAGLAMLAAMALVWALPAYFGGLDQNSGFVAYAQHWKTNSALFPQVERAAAGLLAAAQSQQFAWALARAMVGIVLGAVALWQAWRPLEGTDDLMRRACFVTAALVLLSPAQFPWYMIWMLPFAVFRPCPGLLAVTATVPLYYVSFHYLARGELHVFTGGIVWLMWVPVWALLGWCALRARLHWRSRSAAGPAITAGRTARK